MTFIKYFSLFFLISTSASASLLFGSGFNSATGGRLVPAINAGYSGSTMEVQFSSTGVSTTAYYQSSYRLSTYWQLPAGDFLFGTTDAGFGAGVLYAVRGYKSTTTQSETKTDYVVGPAFQVRWMIAGPFYIAVDALYGLFGPSNRNGDLIALNARDNVNFVIGFKL